MYSGPTRIGDVSYIVCDLHRQRHLDLREVRVLHQGLRYLRSVQVLYQVQTQSTARTSPGQEGLKSLG